MKKCLLIVLLFGCSLGYATHDTTGGIHYSLGVGGLLSSHSNGYGGGITGLFYKNPDHTFMISAFGASAIKFSRYHSDDIIGNSFVPKGIATFYQYHFYRKKFLSFFAEGGIWYVRNKYSGKQESYSPFAPSVEFTSKRHIFSLSTGLGFEIEFLKKMKFAYAMGIGPSHFTTTFINNGEKTTFSYFNRMAFGFLRLNYALH